MFTIGWIALSNWENDFSACGILTSWLCERFAEAKTRCQVYACVRVRVSETGDLKI